MRETVIMITLILVLLIGVVGGVILLFSEPAGAEETETGVTFMEYSVGGMKCVTFKEPLERGVVTFCDGRMSSMR